jgi:hypothetical protein
MLIVLLATASSALASPLPMAFEGRYCDIYSPWCDSAERYIALPNGTVEHSVEIYQGTWTNPTTWGTWTWNGFELEMVNDVPNGWPVKLVADNDFGTPSVSVWEDSGTFISVSDVFYFELDRILR